MRPRPGGVAGIVLAAGKSTRMGTPKQLLPYRGKSILEWVVDTALGSSLDEVILVLGHQAESIAPLFADRDIVTTLNPHFDHGQSTSLQAGLRALKKEPEAVLFLLGDQPLISAGTIDLILSAFKSQASSIVMPVFAGRRGNPVLFSRDLFRRIEALESDRGARDLFEEFRDSICRVEVADSSIHFDVDTEDDYRRLLRLAGEEL